MRSLVFALAEVCPEGSRNQPLRSALDFQSPICHHPTVEMIASSIRLRANAPEGRKAISYQHQLPISQTFTPLCS